MAWFELAGLVTQLVFLILKNKFEEDDSERKRKDELLKDWDQAVKSGDTARINDLLLKLKMRDA